MAVGVALHFYNRVDEEVRLRVEQHFAALYPELTVTVESAELREGEGIRVLGLSIVEPGAAGPRAELFRVEEMLLACRADLQELVGGQPEITRVTIHGPTLRVTRRRDGSWSTSRLWPLPKVNTGGDVPPEVVIEEGIIEIFDPQRNPTALLTLRDVNLTISEEAAEPGATDQPASRVRKIRGTLAGDHLRRAELAITLRGDGSGWTLEGNVQELNVSPQTRDALPGELAEKLAVLGSLQGEGSFDFRLRHDPAADPVDQFDFSGRLAQGQLDDPRLAIPLTDMHATIHGDHRGFSIDELFARAGRATVHVSGQFSGYQPDSPLTLTAEVRQLELDRRTLRVDDLPEALRRGWDHFLPTGRIDADVKLAFDGRRWQPEVTVQCLDVSFSYHRFPYRLERGQGTVALEDDVLRLNLTAFSGGQPVHLSAELTHPFDSPTGRFTARADELTIDDKLLGALQERSRALVDSFHPSGTFRVLYEARRDQPDKPPHQHLRIEPTGCAIRYDKFSYPLGDIRSGALEMTDGRWTFRDLTGTNDTGTVRCNGYVNPTPAGSEFWLELVADNVPLEEELRDALRPAEQRLWNELQLRGMVNLRTTIHRLPNRDKADVSVWVRPHARCTSIEPVYFPYRLEGLDGEVIFRNGEMSWQRLKARHGDTTLTSGGFCRLMGTEGWHLRLDGIAWDRFRVDRDLLKALPDRLKKGLGDLHLQGLMNLHGSLDLYGGGATPKPLRGNWDMRIALDQAGLDCGVRLANAHGELSLVGGFDGKRFQSRGELDLDSVTFKNFQFTQVLGPIWIDDGRLLLGTWVDRPLPDQSPGSVVRPRVVKPRPVTARFHGGLVQGDAWVELGEVPRYGVHATLSQCDLTRFAHEAIAGRQNLKGKIYAMVDLQGSGRSIHGLTGNGTVQLRSGDVAELPLMVGLLRILSARVPDTSGFNESDVDFIIRGNHIDLPRIRISGDTISLWGKGEANFQSEIDLDFRTRIGRNPLQVPVLREILGEASDQMLVIHVDGTLKNPQTRPEVLPLVGRALQQLQEDLQEATSLEVVAPHAWRWEAGKLVPTPQR
ncbi:MAG: hypothetical protein HQ581_08710 [Planctomycetes bacterium]|nr:hypothetical protein [Planctomycetota bacterium]